MRDNNRMNYVLLKRKVGTSLRWPSLYYPVRISGQLSIGKRHPILYYHYTDTILTSFAFSFQTFFLASTKNFFKFFDVFSNDHPASFTETKSKNHFRQTWHLDFVSLIWQNGLTAVALNFLRPYPSSSSSKVSKAVTKFWFWFFNFLFWALHFSLFVLRCSIWSFKCCIVFLYSSTSSSWPVYGFKDFHWL